MKLALIAIGGGFGSVLRYVAGGWIQRSSGGSFPIGTLVINVTGCFAIGFLNAYFGTRLIREEYRLAILVGVLGGYTTFSTFGYETFAAMNERAFLRATMNVALSIILGLLAVWIGYRLAQRAFGVS